MPKIWHFLHKVHLKGDANCTIIYKHISCILVLRLKNIFVSLNFIRLLQVVITPSERRKWLEAMGWILFQATLLCHIYKKFTSNLKCILFFPHIDGPIVFITLEWKACMIVCLWSTELIRLKLSRFSWFVLKWHLKKKNHVVVNCVS